MNTVPGEPRTELPETDLFHALLESAPDAMVVVAEDGSIFMVNAQTERLFRYQRSELLGQPVEILVPERLEASHVAHRDAYIANPQVRPMGAGAPLHGRRKDGSEFPVEISLSPIETSEGVLVASAIRDVTTQLEQLREQGFARVLETSLNEIYIFDARTLRFVHANEGARRNIGYSMEEMRALTPVDIKPEHTNATFAELVKPLENGGEGKVVFETVHQRKDGTHYPVEVHLQLSAFRGASAFVAIILDISERRRLQDELADMNDQLQRLVEERTRELRAAQEDLVRKERLAALGQLAGGVAHEIRTPLGAIRNAAFYLRMKEDGLDEETRDALGDVEIGVTTAEGIVSELLEYVRTPKQSREGFMVSAVVERAVEKVDVPASVQLEVSAVDVSMKADPGQIERILSNLVRNAVQAMPEGGRLSVRVQVDGGTVVFEVTDTGVGIQAEDLERIFEPLYTSKARGIGLGLSVARRYAELNGGELVATSEVSRGSVFRLMIPLQHDSGGVES